MSRFLFLIFFFFSSVNGNDRIKFEVVSDFPSQTIWVKKLLVDSSDFLNDSFLNEYTNLPKTIKVTIKKDARLHSIKANASRVDNSINFTSNVWEKDKYRIWIMIHELTNLLSSYYGCNGYPSDWWANGRSPFPEYISVLTMERIGFKQEALWRKSVHQDKNDHKFYWTLHKKYGTKLFKDFFRLIKIKNIDLSATGKPWPHPDKQRSLVTLGLLSLAANKNLANLANHYNIGLKPKDWSERHPEIKFIEYQITSQDIEEYERRFNESITKP